jgi:hypothetical protein
MNNLQPVIASEFIQAWHQPQTAHVVKCKCAAVNLKWLHKHYFQLYKNDCCVTITFYPTG